MGDIISLPGDQHKELVALLPWYVSDQLEPADRERIDAHLPGCPDCQAEVRFQRQLAAEVKQLPIDVDQGWAEMRRRLDQDQAPRSRTVRGWTASLGGLFGGPSRGDGLSMGGGVLAQGRGLAWGGLAAATVLAAVAMVTYAPGRQTDAYHTLSATPTTASGNVIIMFRPETRLADLRATLDGAQAKVVDGPTASGAYMLRLPAAGRDAALVRLRARPDVLLAEPLDAGPPR